MDYKLDSNFDVPINEWGDFETVDGIEEFRQQVIVRLHDGQDRLIGGTSGSSSVIEKTRSLVARIAREYEVINQISYLDVSYTDSAVDTLVVTVEFDTGDSFTETL